MNWHKRYLQQAVWTRDLRSYLMDKAGFSGADRILDVGCGTGVILAQLAGVRARLGSAKPSLHGIDIDPAALVQGAVHAYRAHLSRADALSLPFPNEAFDITYCHFLLMWLKQPLRALREIKRVTRKGGSVLAIAEPDYGGRLDGPKALVTLGRLQTKALQQQGADVTLGSRLADLMDRAGIHIQETGAINAWPGRTPSPSDLDSEWEILQSDLAHLVSRAELDRLKAIDAHARALGARLLHVPTYFAWGQV